MVFTNLRDGRINGVLSVLRSSAATDCDDEITHGAGTFRAPD